MSGMSFGRLYAECMYRYAKGTGNDRRDNCGLEGTYVWVLNDTYGLMPGYYKMTVSETSPELYYDYELIAMLDEWPGLPLGEKLPE